MPIDFHLTESQLKLRQDARAFAAQVLKGAHEVYMQKPTQTERFKSIRPFYRCAVASGLIKGQIPVELGGTDRSLIDASIALEEIYATDTSVALTVAATGLGLTPLIMSGNEKLQKEHLQPFLEAGDEGEPLASLVHSEPGGTANWLEKGGKGLQTTATKDGDDWLINGEKLWTTNSAGWDGRGADLQCIVCRQTSEISAPQDSDADPSQSIIVFLVTRSIIASNPADSYTILSEPELAGHPATSGPHSRFTNLRVPSSAVLAQGQPASDLVEASFTASAALVGAFSLSIMRLAFDTALKFAKTETRGGTVRLIERQSVADLLIGLKMRIDSSRLLTWKALHGLENGGSGSGKDQEVGGFARKQEICLEAKIWGSENAVLGVTEAMKVVGTHSYSKAMPFPRLLNDAMCLPLFDGGNVGIRRRQMERILQLDEYSSDWAV